MLIHQQYTRQGPDYRFGEQVTFLDIKQTFGFSHVRVGRWVTREEMVSAFAGTHPLIKPSRKGAIARFLLENWLADRLD